MEERTYNVVYFLFNLSDLSVWKENAVMNKVFVR